MNLHHWISVCFSLPSERNTPSASTTLLDTQSDTPAPVLYLPSYYPVSTLEREKNNAAVSKPFLLQTERVCHPKAAPNICRAANHWVILFDFSAGILFEELLPSGDEIAPESII